MSFVVKLKKANAPSRIESFDRQPSSTSTRNFNLLMKSSSLSWIYRLLMVRPLSVDSASRRCLVSALIPALLSPYSSWTLSIHSLPCGPHYCHLLASLISLQLHSFDLTSSPFHVLGFHCILSICLILPTFITDNPVPHTHSLRLPERPAKRRRLEESETPRTPPDATRAASLQTPGMSCVCSL
jgi:hypothetical protein